MIEDLASLLAPELLASVRRQVQPGESVAVYAGDDKERGRAVIVGTDRAYTSAPRSIDRWRLVGIVAITDDSEQSLPIAREAA
jgi:hypothetical protein